MNTVDSKTTLLEHSEAKVALYGVYLAIYLSVLSRVRTVKRIFIIDLFCGEGIYKNDAKGSPLVALDTIKNHYETNKTCPNITLWFNDNELSEIEKGVYKVDRVRRFSSSISLPTNVNIKFHREAYDSILPKAVEEVQKTSHAKGLFFIDPWGYKGRTLTEIQAILGAGNTEVLLFMPVSFMHRVAERSARAAFPGSEPIHRFLTELFGNDVPRFSSQFDFIEQVKYKLRDILRPRGYFVDSYFLERGHGSVYCLFFFTGNILGFEKIIEAKWKMDPHRGRGHSLNMATPLASEIELSAYPQELAKFIAGTKQCTNQNLYLFGLEKGFLPKHTNEVLDRWQKEERLRVLPLNGKPVRGHYLAHDTDRLVAFKLLDMPTNPQD